MKNRLWFLFPVAQLPALLALLVARLAHFGSRELFDMSALALVWCSLIIPVLFVIAIALRCRGSKRLPALATCAGVCAGALLVLFYGEQLSHHLGFLTVKYLHYPGPRFNGTIATLATVVISCVSLSLARTPTTDPEPMGQLAARRDREADHEGQSDRLRRGVSRLKTDGQRETDERRRGDSRYTNDGQQRSKSHRPSEEPHRAGERHSPDEPRKAGDHHEAPRANAPHSPDEPPKASDHHTSAALLDEDHLVANPQRTQRP